MCLVLQLHLICSFRVKVSPFLKQKRDGVVYFPVFLVLTFRQFPSLICLADFRHSESPEPPKSSNIIWKEALPQGNSGQNHFNIYTLEMLWQNTSVIQSYKQREFHLRLRTAAGRDQHTERMKAYPSSSIPISEKACAAQEGLN